MHCVSPGKSSAASKSASSSPTKLISSSSNKCQESCSEISWSLSPAHIPRSLSCLCCRSNTKSPIKTNEIINCDYTIVTHAPKLHTNSVDQSYKDLEKQINDLSQRLKHSEKSRNELKKKLNDAIEERERSYRRLEVISSAHESRITEMHCVIAELSKKLRAKQDTTIAEENEPEGSELSFQCESTCNSDTNLSNFDIKEDAEPQMTEYQNENLQMSKVTNKTQLEVQSALQEEVLHLKAQVAFLQSQIANENDSSPEAHQNNKISRNNDTSEIYFESAITECISPIQEIKRIESFSDNDESCNNFMRHAEAKYVKTSCSILSKENINRIEKQNCGTPVTKMAERVKLRRTIEDHHITGTEILNSGINNTEIVEHLVSDVIQSESLIEASISATQLKMEVQRLQRRIEHLKARNSVLVLTLDECKKHCEHLYLLCGKYESNAVALQAALNCSDRAIEAYDVMLALLESKLALSKEKSLSAQESRKAVEAVARHLLDRFESEKNITENSLGPWQNTVCISSSEIIDPWTQEDDNRLRSHVSKLKGKRSAIQNTVVTFESPFYSDEEKSRSLVGTHKDVGHENLQMDLEMAVLMQEVLSLREEVIEARQLTESSEREKSLAVDKVRMLQDALTQLQTQLTDSEALLAFTSQDRSSYSEADHAAAIERQLVEALTRESQLKNRIQTLIGTVSVTKKTSEEKYAQAQSNLTELQKANISLSQTLDVCKKKYQSRIKRLEQKIIELNIVMNQRSPQLEMSERIPETTL